MGAANAMQVLDENALAPFEVREDTLIGIFLQRLYARRPAAPACEEHCWEDQK